MTSKETRMSPTVVFISQLGTGGDSWRPVIAELESGAETFTYDRPGTGSAPPRPAPNPPLPYSAFADELKTLLDAAGVNGPLVVVGHSMGSLIARMFVDRHPERVAGVVHVEGSIPRAWLFADEKRPPTVDGDGPDATAFDRVNGEVEVMEAFVPQVPSAVLARTPGILFPGDPPEFDTLWFAFQRQLARQHNCPLVIADHSSHQVPADAPHLVARLVDHVVAGGSPLLHPDVLAEAGGHYDGDYRPDLGIVSTPYGKAWARKSLEVARARTDPAAREALMRDLRSGQKRP